MAVVRLRYNGGIQAVAHAPAAQQSADGAWELQDLRYPAGSTEYVAASGTATLDTYSEVLTADAGPGQADPLRITVAVMPTVGTVYWLADDRGGEPVEIEGTASAYAVVSQPIIGTYDTDLNATLAGQTLTASIPAAVAAREDAMQHDHLLRLVWTYSNGERHQQQVRVRRNDFDDADLYRVRSDVVYLFPDIHLQIEHRGAPTLRRMVEVVYRMVAAQERGDGEEPSLRLGGEERHFALVWRTLMHAASLGVVPGTEDPDAYRDYCRDQWNTFFGGVSTGPGGKETGRASRSTDAATGPEDLVHRGIVLGL